MTIPGINIIGDLTARRGLTEAARSTINVIRQQGIEFSFIEERYVAFPDDQRDSELGFPITQLGNVYPINLMFYGIAGFHNISDEELQRATAGKYTIAYWVWEFSTMPEEYRLQIARVDEIWTASQFCKQCFATMTDKPIRVIPHPIAMPDNHSSKRDQFGITTNRYMFLFVFDTTGSIARKNPTAVIDAFEEAFGCPDANGPILVLRARHLNANPAYRTELLTQLQRVGGMMLADEYSREQTNELMACTDAYVSLHRAEGYGLTMAEAMALGKPVIATGYSGNLDFMTEANSYLVNYKLRPTTLQDHTFQPFFNELYAGREWADPDIHQAARWMRYMVDYPAEAAARGKLAAKNIQRCCSPAVVGPLVKEYLDQLDL